MVRLIGSIDTANYDAQDRILNFKGLTYNYDLDGNLILRGQDSFEYRPTGEILQATIGNSTVTYSYDALHRRMN